MEIIKFSIRDLVVMKKKHPCGSDTFVVTRLGTDVGLECCNCKRNLILPRIKLEKSIKRVIHQTTLDM